ncbi:4'-phosphopantetheinyl transferase family protein [Aquibacillus rhizosphaerae]|uniref:4'-phosphopantetheinyl transferase superfamily protein n=1 Tax=Aquibacillus rhizosphaerae TaxID=3051431 RepID=A0ABT7L3S7_9BACI|nr:4'-phosphopantetheinyl transferase superfamily protein [Aquibacillus sp. LR5S19]MDL4840521.1 4'-phosphopantetheinyl transferase superfamily protein [Aquibacillus sp. LR5S19]
MDNRLVEIYVCKLPQKRSTRDVEELLPYLSKERIERIRKFKFLNDQFRSIIGDIVIQYLFAVHHGEKLSYDRVKYNRYGKPFLPDFPAFHYNISHSGECLACAIHHSPVGIDLEQLKPFDFKFVKSFFTRNEYKTIVRHVDQVSAFYQTWTAKESVVKAIGKGLSYPLSSFEVIIQQSGKVQLIDVNGSSQIDRFSCRTYRVDKDFILSVCAANGEQFPMELKEIPYQSLLEKMALL